MVLPVVHDALGPDRSVLDAAVTRFDGVSLRADQTDTPVYGSPPAEHVEVVRATCERFGLPIDVLLDDGQVSVTAPGIAAVNEPLRALLRVCELLLSNAAREHDLVVLTFPTQGLDDDREALLWALTVQQVPPHLPEQVRAFVPIWEGTVDVRRHCSGDPSVRYAVQSGRLIVRRGGGVALDAAIARLVRNPDRPLVLFLGAGFSRSARLPLGDAVRDDAVAFVLNRPVGADGLHETFRRWLIDQGRLMQGETDLSAERFSERLTLERVLREEFRNLREEGRSREDSAIVKRLQEECRKALEWVPPAREAVRRLARVSPRLVIMTVNFDRLVEDDLGSDNVVFAAPDEFGSAIEGIAHRLDAGGGPLPIVKFHGDIERPETIVADVDQTSFGLPPDARQLLDAVIAGARPVTWVWVGCSMRDLDVNEWLRQQSGHHDMFEWWVDPLPGPSLDVYWQQFRRKDAHERDIDYARQRLLPEIADRFLSALADAVEAATEA